MLGGHAFRATVSSRDSLLVGHTLNEAEMFHLVKLTWNDMQSDIQYAVAGIKHDRMKSRRSRTFVPHSFAYECLRSQFPFNGRVYALSRINRDLHAGYRTLCNADRGSHVIPKDAFCRRVLHCLKPWPEHQRIPSASAALAKLVRRVRTASQLL